MWISDRNMIDLLACGAAVLPIIFYFAFSIFIPNISSSALFSMINSLVYSAIYIALALKVKDSNAMIALLLICMFGYNVFFSRIISNLLANASVVATLTALVSYAANVAGAALCFLAVRAEE
jgi:hypothetical protein